VRLTGAVNLTAEGLQVREAGEGLDALDQAPRCEGPDLVLTDVKKPSLAGFQLARLGRRAGARSGASGFG
jgi:CheY-like chemotaxis protein